YFFLIVLILSIATSAQARKAPPSSEPANTTVSLPISAAVGMKNSKTLLRKDVKLYFGEHVPTHAVEASLGIVYGQGDAPASTAKSKSKSHKDDPACKEAMRAALARMI